MKIGRRDEDAMGGLDERFALSVGFDFSKELKVVLATMDRPDTIGGGSSRPSVAFLLN